MTSRARGATQSTECEPLHFLVALDQLARNLPLQMSPKCFVRVQLRRVRRQVEQLELAVQALDVALNHLCLVDRMTVNDQKDELLGIEHQALEELDEHFRADRSLMQHEPKFALRADGRDHVQREAPAGRLHHRHPALRAQVVPVW